MSRTPWMVDALAVRQSCGVGVVRGCPQVDEEHRPAGSMLDHEMRRAPCTVCSVPVAAYSQAARGSQGITRLVGGIVAAASCAVRRGPTVGASRKRSVCSPRPNRSVAGAATRHRKRGCMMPSRNGSPAFQLRRRRIVRPGRGPMRGLAWTLQAWGRCDQPTRSRTPAE